MSRALKMLVYGVMASAQLAITLFLITHYTHGAAYPVPLHAIQITPQGSPTGGALGVFAESFLLLKDVETVSGIDVSKHNADIDLSEMVKCGGRFVYIRLQEGTNASGGAILETKARDFWGLARKNHLLIGAYDYLDINIPSNSTDIKLDNDLAYSDAVGQAHGLCRLRD